MLDCGASSMNSLGHGFNSELIRLPEGKKECAIDYLLYLIVVVYILKASICLRYMVLVRAFLGVLHEETVTPSTLRETNSLLC